MDAQCVAIQCGAGEGMPDRLTVRLPEDLQRALEAASRRMLRKQSEIVRLALREYLAVDTSPNLRPADHVRSLTGSVESGVPDLAEKHRAYIIDRIKGRRRFDVRPS